MEAQTLLLLSAFVTLVVDRIRAAWPETFGELKGARTNLLAIVVGVIVAVVGDLGVLAADLLPAIETDSGVLANLVAGVLLATGGAAVDWARQIGSSRSIDFEPTERTTDGAQ